MTPEEFDAKVASLHKLQDEILREAYDPGPTIPDGSYDFSREWLVKTHIPMGVYFMIEMLPMISRCVRETRGDLSIMDVGSGMAVGTELLAQILLLEKRNITVSCCDNAPPMPGTPYPRYTRYCRAFNRRVAFSEQGLDALPDKSQDIVISSNMLEHYEDPAPLILKLRSVARHFVVILVPFAEPLGHYRDHHFSFTRDYVERLKPVDVAYGQEVSGRVCFILKP